MKKTILLFIISILVNYTLIINNCQAQWVQTSGPISGWISSFAVIGNNLFAGTYSNGVFRSTNNGANWSQVNNGLNYDEYISSFTVIGTNLFAGARGQGVYLSTNNGVKYFDRI